MKLVLFKSLRGQHSMERYARALAAALKGADPGLDVEIVPPPDFPRRPFHWRKYVSYQRAARGWAGAVNHVADHGYGHLVSALPAQSAVVTVHDMGPLWSSRSRFRGREGGLRAALAYRWSVRAMRAAARVVAVSESARRDLLEFTGWPEERVGVIPSGVGESFRPGVDAGPVAEKLGLGGRRFVLHVGGSTARKNLATVLRALPLLDDDLLLVKVGAALEAPERALAGGAGVLDRVREVGDLEDEDLAALYCAAEALVFPSLYEGFGWPPLEAMACGTPAVVSGIPALRETSGPAAVVLEDAESPEEIASAVRRCLRGSAERESLVAASTARAAEFRWERAAGEYLGLYREVAEGRT
ncbi:MAG: glycosyltransferase family 4 protein [Planctomycetota bacterium]|jgi:glycosyltransferase involved in cell wall biosynthesis